MPSLFIASLLCHVVPCCSPFPAKTLARSAPNTSHCHWEFLATWVSHSCKTSVVLSDLAKPILSQRIMEMGNSVNHKSDNHWLLACTHTVVHTFVKVKTMKMSHSLGRANIFCRVFVISTILKIPCEWRRGWDMINKACVTWPSAAINLHHLPVSTSLRFSLCFHISLSLPLRPTSPSSPSNSILLER